MKQHAIKDYSILIDVMEEIHETTHDEYGLKALLTSLEKFETFLGLKLAFLLFEASEDVSKSLQAKNTTLQEAMTSVKLASEFYKRQRSDEAFNLFYVGVLKSAEELGIDQPQLPRYRRPPRRLDSGSSPHKFSSAKEYYWSLYFESCDLLIQELQDRFDQQEILPPVIALETLLMKAANGEPYDDQLHIVENSCYKNDFNFSVLKRHLSMLVDIVKEACPEVKRVTTVRTLCDAMNTNPIFKNIFSEVHKLLWLYLTIPITSSTAERTFSVLRRLLTYLRSTMTEKRLNNCLLLHIHKDLTDEIDIAKEFISVNNERKLFFWFFLTVCTYE